MSNENQRAAPSKAPPLPRRQPQPGDVLDGTYRIDRVLGYGGVGVVCAAWHLHVQRPCAVKFLHPYLVSNPELRARFRREAQSAFQLGHPHIVSITDFRDDSASWPYIVMELVTGETLRSRLERGPLPPRLAVRMMTELCDALNTAHRRGVIHRDLKPENLFLTHASGGEEDDDLVLKVLDFGLSKILDESDITESGRLLGSPSYMSPEQARGESHLVDARSDIFAVGVLLYECLTAYKLFEAPNFEQKRQLIMAAQLPPLKLVQRGMPEALEQIIHTACALRPEDRYQTAAQLADALASVYGDEGVQAVRPELSGRAARLTSPPMQAISAGAGAARAQANPSGQSPRQQGFEPTLPAGARRSATPAAVPVVDAAAPVGAAPSLSLAGPGGESERVTSVEPGEVLPVPPEPRRKPLTWLVVMVSGMALGGALALGGYRYLRQPDPPGAPLSQPMPGPRPSRDGAPPRPDSAPRPAVKQPASRTPERPDRMDHPRPKEAGPTRVEQLTIEAVNPVMAEARPGLARCFPADTPLPRRLQVDIVIAPTGRVRDATADAGEDVQGCVVDRLMKLRFPSFTGEPTNVHYEFVNMQR